MDINNKFDSDQQLEVFRGTIEEERLHIKANVLSLVRKTNKQFVKVDQEGTMLVIKIAAGRCKRGEPQLKHITYTYPKFRERMLQEAPIIVDVYEKDGVKKYKKEKFADVFLEHPASKFYVNGVSMNPYLGDKDPTHKSVYNMYKGLSAKRIPYDMDKIDTFIEIVEKSLCGDRKNESEFLLDLISWQLANPHRKSGVATLFRGAVGTFKGSFFEAMRSINKHHTVKVQGKKQLVGSFNAVLAYATFVFADEVDFKNQETADALKDLITEPTIIMEKKHGDAFELDSYINLYGATNREGKLELEGQQRRWFCLESDKRYSSKAENNSLHIDLRNRFRAQLVDKEFPGMLLDWLLERANKLPGNWHAQDMMPQTLEEIKNKVHSLKPKEQWLQESISQGYFLGSEAEDWNDRMIIPHHDNFDPLVYEFQELKLAFASWCTAGSRNKGRASLTEFKDLLQPLGVEYKRPLINGAQVACFSFSEGQDTLNGKFKKVILNVKSNK